MQFFFQFSPTLAFIMSEAHFKPHINFCDSCKADYCFRENKVRDTSFVTINEGYEFILFGQLDCGETIIWGLEELPPGKYFVRHLRGGYDFKRSDIGNKELLTDQVDFNFHGHNFNIEKHDIDNDLDDCENTRLFIGKMEDFERARNMDVADLKKLCLSRARFVYTKSDKIRLYELEYEDKFIGYISEPGVYSYDPLSPTIEHDGIYCQVMATYHNATDFGIYLSGDSDYNLGNTFEGVTDVVQDCLDCRQKNKTGLYAMGWDSDSEEQIQG